MGCGGVGIGLAWVSSPFGCKNSLIQPVMGCIKLSLSKKGLSGFITRQATKLMRDKMYE
jgi:hypothetical protein